MKKTLTHLPENKKAELKKITNIIRESCNDVEMIILFGSYGRGDWKEEKDLKPNRKSGHKSDYDILTVTGKKETAENTVLWKDITEKTSAMELSTHARIIAHDIQDINIKLAEGQYFYTDIKKEGRILYESGNYKLARKRKLRPEEMKRIAQDHFDHWYERAKNFFTIYSFTFEKQMNKEAAFNLNQAAESSYKAIILVFTNYNPREHYLRFLNAKAGKYNKAIKELFRAKTEKEQKLFDLLDYAYIGARYDAGYRIEKEELEYLSEKVRTLLKMTEEMCREKIGSYGKKGKLSTSGLIK